MSATDKFFKGENQILYIKYNDVFAPVACLTTNSLDENIELLDTTTTQNGGWKTQKGTNQSYTINFEGLSIAEIAPNDDKLSIYLLRTIKRARTIFDWEIRTNANQFKSFGKGIITQIGEVAQAGEFITFSGQITGFGRLFQENTIQGGITWDNDIITMDNTIVTWDNNG